MIEQNGKKYFSYGVGLKFRYKDSDKEFNLEIISCYVSPTQVEYYFASNNGIKMPKPFSLKRLEFLLNYNCAELMSEGVRREYPLMPAEVELYYSRVVKPKAQARRAAEQKLKSTPYYELEQEKNKLVVAITLGELAGANCKEMRSESERLRSEQRRILQSLGISEKVLFGELKICEYCGGTGFVFSYTAKDNREICPCAYERRGEIKAYAAVEG